MDTKMNERIKQLWEEAAKTTQGDSWEEQTKFMERYTGLIVRECASICDERSRSAPIGSDEQCEAEDCSYSIKKYFGVEE